MLLALSPFHGTRPKEMDAKKTVIDVDGFFHGSVAIFSRRALPFNIPFTSPSLSYLHGSQILFLFHMSSAGMTNSTLRHCASPYRTVLYANPQQQPQTAASDFL